MIKRRFVLFYSCLKLGNLLAFLVCHADFQAQLLQLCAKSIVLVLQEQDQFYQLVEGHLFQLGQIVARHGRHLALLLVQVLPRFLLVNPRLDRFQHCSHSCALSQVFDALLNRLGEPCVWYVHQTAFLVGLFGAEVLIGLHLHVLASAACVAVV